MIWLALLIPVFTVIALLWKFNRKMVWWEYLIIFAAPALCIGLSKSLIETVQTSDTEFWGGYVETAQYFEKWNERVSCSHAKYESYTDSDGNTHTRFVGYEHAYDVDYHPPYWVVNTTIGDFTVDQSDFEYLVKRFGNKKFVDLHRSYHTIDGDKYVTIWPVNEPEKLKPVTDTRTYTNRVQASRSVFNFKEVNPKDYQLFEYPKIEGLHQRSILGNGGPTHIQAEKQLDYLNAVLGGPKRVRMFVLVFKNQPLQAALDQESYWKGGNKNELITCVGVDDTHSVQWVYVFSWSDSETLKIEARDFINKQKQLDLVSYVEWLGPQVNQSFIKKDFRQFDYISVDPPTWAIVTVYLITIAICVGLAFWSVLNPVENV